MELVGYFLKSDEQKRLLELLFFKKEELSASQLAGLSGLPYTTVCSELKRLKKCGVVSDTKVGRATLYKSLMDAELKNALGTLLGFSKNPEAREPEDADVKSTLQQLGAPVVVEGATAPPPRTQSLEETFVRATLLAKKDPSVARALPVALVKNQGLLDWDTLLVHARRLDAKQETGFFLALTGELSNENKWKGYARMFKDKRVQQTTDFFLTAHTSTLQRQLAERNTPDVARRWKFRMNMSLDTFKSTFLRFA